MRRVSIIIPTYNEKENIRHLIPEIFRVFEDNGIDGKIIIIDDNSPDGTAEEAKALSKKHNVILISRPRKAGIGSAYITGFKRALQDSDVIFEMDADHSHNPKDIPAFIEKLKDSDVVIGSRYVDGGGILGWGIYRAAVSRIGNLTAKTFLDLKISDITTGYRAYRKEVLEAIDLDAIKSNGYAFQAEIIYLISRKGFNIREVPITFRNREIGESKLSQKEIVWFLITCLRLRIKG
jgi:dolichol-phosphate mannosyltransferase